MLEYVHAVRPDNAAQMNNDTQGIRALLPILNKREQHIITHRFGLDGGDAMILEDIGRGLSITRERFRQIQEGALKKLKKKMMEKSVESSYTLAYS